VVVALTLALAFFAVLAMALALVSGLCRYETEWELLAIAVDILKVLSSLTLLTLLTLLTWLTLLTSLLLH
jgi:hypothetical protein